MISFPIDFNDLQTSSGIEWCALSAPKDPIWICNTESPVVRVAKDILSVVIFPIGLARLLHRVIGNFVVLAAIDTKCGESPRYDVENLIKQNWKIKRISIQVDGRIVDAAVVMKQDQAQVQPNRWTLLSCGNREFLQNLSNLELVDKLQSNAVYYNYPGVAGSTGEPSRSTIAKTSRVMLRFLEEQCQAKEIIWYGHSLGGGAQEAFADHTRKEGVQYCLIKSRTFSHLRKVVQDMFGGSRLISFLVWLFGWDMSPVASVKNSPVPQIILQTDPSYFPNGNLIPHSDGIITEAASLAKAVEHDENANCNPLFIPETHNRALTEQTIEILGRFVQQAGFAMRATT